jgi:class 3 adenylate cyclase/streptogramin lyase
MPSRAEAGKRFLATVLFTDIVGSTDVATELGDKRWRELLARHHALIRRELKKHGGREVDTAGDGFFATFTAPADGVRCACAASRAVQELGIDIRAGVHVGECEAMGSKVGGIAVHTGARVLSASGPADVLATSTVKELVAGAGIEFEDRGVHHLKGITGEWRLYAVVGLEGPPPPLDAEVAAAARERIVARPVLGRSRSRTPIIIGLAAVLLAAAVGAFVLTRGGGSVTPAPNSVSEIRAGEKVFARTFGVGSDPIGVASDGAHIWVINQRSGTIQQIDPDANPPVGQPVSTFGATTGLAAGDGAAWITSGNVTTPDATSIIYRFDAKTNQMNRVTDAPPGVGAIAYANGSLWVADPNTDQVLHIDPKTGSVVDTIDVGKKPVAIAAGPGETASIWVANGLGNSVSRIAPGSATAESFPVGSSPSGIAVDPDGDVWVTSSEANTVTRLDPTGHLIATIERVPPGASSIAVAGGSVWVAATIAPFSVVRIDAGTNRVSDTVVVNGTPSSLTVDAAGNLWATVRSG